MAADIVGAARGAPAGRRPPPLRGDERHRLVAHRDEYEPGVRGIVARGRELGLMDVEDPGLAVAAAPSACTQVERWYRPDGSLDAPEVTRRISDFLLAGFGVRRPILEGRR